MGHRIAIFDRQSRFVKRLADYFNEKYMELFEVMAFDDAEKFLRYITENTCHLCFVSRSGLNAYQTEQILDMEIPIVYISDDKKQDGIYQYQSVSKIATEMLDKCLEFYPELTGSSEKKKQKESKWIGFYSPCRSLLQSSIALTMGQLLGEEKKVLYINFEAFAGFQGILQRESEQDLSDFIFYLKEDEAKMKLRLQTMLSQIGNLYYLPPISSFLDLQDMTQSDWNQFFEIISQQIDMDVVILDLSELVKGLPDVLSACEEIYTCYDENEIAKEKLKQYKRFIVHIQRQDILDKTAEYEIMQMQRECNPLNLFLSGALKQVVQKMWKKDF